MGRQERRRELGVSEGDDLDVEVVDNGVLVRPLTDQERVGERVFKAMESVEYVGPSPEPGEDELMEMVVDEIHAMRCNDDESRFR